jgi:hypothetical protein
MPRIARFSSSAMHRLTSIISGIRISMNAVFATLL